VLPLFVAPIRSSAATTLTGRREIQPAPVVFDHQPIAFHRGE
jgi:hypothetical protein